jgi:plasmid stability protein
MTDGQHGATLYLRGLPEAVVREAKARAARRGITLTAYVAEILGRAAAADEDGPPRLDAKLEADLDWYREHRDRLAACHAGEYLAIVDQQVIDHDHAFAPLARRVHERFGKRAIVMPKCVPEGRIVRLPSPRIDRS